MENNEHQDFELEQENDEMIVDDTQVEDTIDQEADEVDWKAEALKYKAILARKAKPKQEVKPAQKSVSGLSREEAILFAKGYEEKDIDYLNLIAKGKGVSLAEAQKDELFMAYQEKAQIEKKSAQAKLRASNSSGYSKPTETFAVGMSEADHKALWKKQMGL